MGRRLALSALLLAGCAPGPDVSEPAGPASAEALPRAVAVAMAVGGGQPLTAYFTVVPNPRGHLDVRVVNDLELPGEQGVFRLAPEEGARPGWELTEQLRHARVPLLLPPDAALRPTRLEPASAWFFPESGAGYRCDLRTGACAEAPTRPEVELTHTGPGHGFRFTLTDRTLRFHLPRQDDAADGEIVATRVREVIGVRWMHTLPDGAVQEYLDRTFRGRGTLRATAGDVVVDGQMDEWTVAEPGVVDAPWQARVRDHWRGPTDASFSVDARSSAARLCFGGRFRDDDLRAGDTLTFAVGPARVTLDLAAGTVRVVAVGEEAAAGPPEARVSPELFGWHYEVCVPHTPLTRERREVAFAAWYTDVDGADPADELGTAPVAGDTPTGTLEFGR